MSLKRIPLGVYLLTLASLPLAGLAVAAATRTDVSKEGVYQSGLWRYEASVSNRGSKSEGYHGTLLYNGDILPEPAAVNDYYQTPWGPMYWVGTGFALGQPWLDAESSGPRAGGEGLARSLGRTETGRLRGGSRGRGTGHAGPA